MYHPVLYLVTYFDGLCWWQLVGNSCCCFFWQANHGVDSTGLTLEPGNGVLGRYVTGPGRTHSICATHGVDSDERCDGRHRISVARTTLYELHTSVFVMQHANPTGGAAVNRCRKHQRWYRVAEQGDIGKTYVADANVDVDDDIFPVYEE